MNCFGKKIVIILCTYLFFSSALFSQTDLLKEKQDYAVIYGLYKDGLYDLAYEEINKFLEKYPNSQNTSDAVFIKAECLFKQDKFKEAINEYNEFIIKYP